MAGQSEHPIEAVYAARDALGEALRRQQASRSGTLRRDFPAYGSALLETLTALTQLTGMLADDIDQIDPDHVQRMAQHNQPEASFEHAVTHLRQLYEALNAAVLDAGRYWTRIDEVRTNTHPDFPPDPD